MNKTLDEKIRKLSKKRQAKIKARSAKLIQEQSEENRKKSEAKPSNSSET
ncbi:hypothetical protein MYX76_05350 [Desulfobacterota bacterium AH_259_B03_O07]|nr:hypothetical protein [Desulfobacterota bacterium AH_259_B03_O07]